MFIKIVITALLVSVVPLHVCAVTPKAAIKTPAVSASFLKAVRASLDDTLNDYQTARFKDVRITAGHVICGSVNSKNAVGGYTGWQPFMGGDSNDGGASVVVADINTAFAFKQVCDEPHDWLPTDYSKQVTYRP